MNKCYYCNNSPRGCAECRKAKQEALAPVWKLVDMGGAGESLKSVERHPIRDERKLERVLGTPSTEQTLAKGALLDADWATQLAWFKGVQHWLRQRVGEAIELELVREPSNRYPIVVSRTQGRVQAWSLSMLYHYRAVMADDPDATAEYIATWWRERLVKPAAKATKAAINIINHFPAAPLNAPLKADGTWEQQEPNVYPSPTDSLTLWGDEVNKLTERDMLKPIMRQGDGAVHGELTAYFACPPEMRERLINGAWVDLSDEEDDETLDAIYYGSRAGGKTLHMTEQQEALAARAEARREYYNSLAQEPMLLVHDECHTVASAEYAAEMSKPLHLQDLGKIVEKFEALSPAERHRAPNLRTLSNPCRSIDLGSQPGWTTLRVGEYEMRLREPNPFRIDAIAARVGLYWQKRVIEMLEGAFKDNEPKG